MTDRISLTAAELAFLLSASGGAARSPAPGLLGFTDSDSSDAVLAAGLGSLLLRHLATPAAEQQVELVPAVTAVAEGISSPRVCVQVGLVADGFADGALLFESGPVRFLLAPRAYRCFDITGVDPTVDRREPLVLLARSFLARHRRAVASFNVVTGDPPAGWVSVAAVEDGTWTFAAQREADTPIVCASAEDALDRLRAELGRLTPRLAGTA